MRSGALQAASQFVSPDGGVRVAAMIDVRVVVGVRVAVDVSLFLAVPVAVLVFSTVGVRVVVIVGLSLKSCVAVGDGVGGGLAAVRVADGVRVDGGDPVAVGVADAIGTAFGVLVGISLPSPTTMKPRSYVLPSKTI